MRNDGPSAADDRRDAAVRRALGLLLRVYPAGFRREMGQDLVETAVHRRSELARRHGTLGSLRFWLTEGVRFAFDGMLERAHSMPPLFGELRYAWRQIRRAPAQHALTIATLAVGIGATTAVFTLADTVVFRPLPYADARALYLIHARFGGTEMSSHSLPNLRELQTSIATMSWLAGAADRSPALADHAGAAERVSVLDVTEGYLPGLAARVVIGRPFTDQDRAAGAQPVAIVSHALWQRRWGANLSVLGSTVRLNGSPVIVVGVMTPAFRDPEPVESGAVTDLWVPVRSGDYDERDDFSFRVLGRLAAQVSAVTASQELTQAGHRLAAEHPAANRDDGADLDFVLYPLHEATVSGARDRILLVLGAVVLLLILACANAASLLLARGVSRSSELAVRSALGASQTRLALQLFGETLLMTAIAGVLGGFMGALGLRAFVAASPAGIPRLHELTLDLRALVVVAGLTGLTALMFGIVPALRGARAAKPGASASARTTASKQTQRTQAVLVAVEVAMSLVLVTSAGLLLGSVRHLLNVPPGFDAANVIVVEVRPPFTARTAEATTNFHTTLRDRAASTPGIARAALAFSVPGMSAGAWTRVTPDNAAAPIRGSEPGRAPASGVVPGPDSFSFNSVSPEFFAVLNIPLRAGRLFDSTERSRHEVVLSEAAARRFFPGVAVPIGRRLVLGAPNSDSPVREVVGIVGDVRQRGPGYDIEPQIYVPYQQRDIGRLNLVLEQRAGALVSADTIRQAVRDVAPDVPVDRIEGLATRYAATRAETRLLAALLTTFAVMGLVLAAIGTYATVSHAFSRRVREVAIRLALGAHASGVFRLVLSRALGIAAVGIAGGLALTLLLGRFLEGQLHGVTAHDPLTIGMAVLGIGVAVALAALRPGIKASRVDPNKVLRAD